MPSVSARRSPARWLAPLALTTVAVVVALVATQTLSDESKTSTVTRTTATTPQRSTGSKAVPRPRTYTVKSGDVLSVIAERYGVSVSRIESLNPDVDAQTLRPGIRLRLRR